MVKRMVLLVLAVMSGLGAMYGDEPARCTKSQRKAAERDAGRAGGAPAT